MKAVLGSLAFWRLFLINFLFFCSLNVLNVIPDWLVNLGATKTYVGFFMNINSLALVLLVLPLSHFTDRIGRRAIIIGGFLTGIVSLVLMIPFAQNLAALAILRTLGSLAFCAGFTIHGVEGFELIPVDKRVAGMAIYGISGLLSNPVSTFTGELVLGSSQPTLIFGLAAAFLVASLLVSLGHRYHRSESGQRPTGLLTLARRKEVIPLVLLAIIMGGAFATYASFLANFSRLRLGTVSISLFFTAFSGIAIASRLFFSGFIDRLPPRILGSASYFSIALSFVLSTQLSASQPWLMIPMGLLYGLGHSLLFPLISTLMVNSGAASEKLGLNNLFASVNTMGNILVALVMGMVADIFSLDVVFPAMALVCAAGGVLALLSLHRKNQGASGPPR